MKSFVLFPILLLLLCSCGTKRQYFEPAQTDGELKYSRSLNAKIVDTNLFSAKLSDNSVIVKNEDNIEGFKLEKGYTLLAYQNGEFITADDNGNLKIFGSNHEEVYSEKFHASVLSVALDGDDLALILADNTIVLTNRISGVKFSQTLSSAIAQDSRVAAPVFLESIIVYPSLDGKIVIFSRQSQRILRDVIVSAEYFFNNIIYLNVMGDKMIAATAKKILILYPSKTLYLDADIKDVVLSQDAIFVLSKDGNVIKTDFNLNKIAQKKFDFALFTQAGVYNDHLYIIEKTGYLIKCDLDLRSSQVFKFPDISEKMSFIGVTKLYYADRVLDLF